METATFIRTLKSTRTRYTKTPNAEKEKQTLDSLIAKMGGDVLALIAVKDDKELRKYLIETAKIAKKEITAANKEIKAMAAQPQVDIHKPVAERTEADAEAIHEVAVANKEEAESAETPAEETPAETPAEKPVKKSKPSKEERFQVCTTKNGQLVEIDTVKKTCHKIYHSFSEINPDDLDIDQMSMDVYKKYLADRYPNDEVVLKKNKVMFRGYRISCNTEDGFIIEDTQNKYKVIETPFDGIPTPKELGDFFSKPVRTFTQEELKEMRDRQRKREQEEKDAEKARIAEREKASEPVDLERCRRNVLRQIKEIREKKGGSFDPQNFPEMIPFKAWRRKCNQLLKAWMNKEIRYAKFINELEEYTETISFESKEKTKRNAFTGTLLPAFEEIGMLKGDKIEVDGKDVDAVPFMLQYILHYEPKVMPQLMKFAAGELSDVALLMNPIENDGTIEYKKNALANTIENARLLTALCASIGLVAPQDLLYKADLEVGDKIMLAIDGEWKTRTIMSTEDGICISKGIGITKFDKWIKLPKKETK